MHCHLFFDVLDETVQRRGIEVHAYALMPNHYHLLLRSPSGNLSRAMQDINGNYSRRLNRIYSWDGPLFRGRFKGQVVEDDDYLKHLVAYLHLNPVRAHLVTEPSEHCWTSHQEYLGLTAQPRWLSCDFMKDLFGGARSLHEFVMGQHRGSIPWPAEMDLETGWFQVMQQRAIGVSGLRPSKPPSVRHDAEAILEVVLQAAACTEVDLLRIEKGPGANPARRFAVLALDRWTQLTQREIGTRLGMTTTQVAKVLERNRSLKVPLLFEWMKALERQVSSGDA